MCVMMCVVCRVLCVIRRLVGGGCGMYLLSCVVCMSLCIAWCLLIGVWWALWDVWCGMCIGCGVLCYM